jgi:hypothetical protein
MDMGEPFGEGSTCLRVAASAKAGAHLLGKHLPHSIRKLELN